MASKLAAEQDLSQQLRAENLPAALRRRQLRLCRGQFEGAVHIVVLTSGTAQLEGEGEPYALTAPAAVILPPSPHWLLTLEAGAEGALFGLLPAILGEVMGARPEFELMMPLGRQLILASDAPTEGPMGAEGLAQSVLAELEGSAAGQRIAILSYLRLLIVAIWRATRQEATPPQFGSDAHLLENFRREVEVHFRSHLLVEDYALRLGISASRLRRVCQRHLSSSPLELIHRRLLREARAWLEHSGHSVASIALALGFGDSAEFSHFFKRHSGLSPSHFREALRKGGAGMGQDPSSFADWP